MAVASIENDCGLKQPIWVSMAVRRLLSNDCNNQSKWRLQSLLLFAHLEVCEFSFDITLMCVQYIQHVNIPFMVRLSVQPLYNIKGRTGR